MIEQVEKLGPELDLMVLRDREVLEQGSIEVKQAGRDQRISPQSAEHADRGQHELACIDVGVRIAFLDRITVTTGNQAGTQSVPVSDGIRLGRAVFFDGKWIA